jgi:hypothetical protein
MAKDQKAAKAEGGGNVLSLAICPFQGCGKKASRSEFCGDHFMWFKEGLISRTGEKPKDFDKKYQAYLARTRKAG